MNAQLLWLTEKEPSLAAFIQYALDGAFSSVHILELLQWPDGPEINGAQSLLVLVEPGAGDLTRLRAWLDQAEEPARPVVLFSSTLEPADGLDVIRPGAGLPWAIGTLRNAGARHALRRENARLKGDLLTIGTRLAHDLRTPLGGINISADFLREVLKDEQPKLVELVKPILDSSTELSGLIGQVSVLLKATVRGAPRSPVNMRDPVVAAYERLERSFLERKVSLLQPPEWPQVRGVPAWLETIWWHLIQNALQHGEPFPRLELDWDRAGGHCRFWVEDNGAGVPPEREAKLFQPFDQLHDSSARRGLGLSIVQRLVELQDGDCFYEKSADNHPRFGFRLPVV